MAQLQGLDLCGTLVTDAGLQDLVGLKQLRYFNLGKTQVTDMGLKYVKGLNELHFLDLREPRVTEVGVKKLQQALPSCKIKWTRPTHDEQRTGK